MKKNFFKFTGLFLAGVMVMQGVFAAGDQAKAAVATTAPEAPAPEDLEAQLDDVPKTADETNLRMVFTLMGGALTSMVGMLIINNFEKRKKRM